MATSTRIDTVPLYKPILDSRADHVCRWSAYGSRAYAGVQRKSVHTPIRPFNDKRPLIWFGGNGLQAGFTVSNVEPMFADCKYRKGTVGLTREYYHSKLKSISIHKACEILARLGCADDTFYRVCSDPGSKKYTRCTPAEVVAQEGWYTGSGWLCAAINSAVKLTTIEFLGGPPSRWGVYKGSLFTLLIDRITVMILLGGSIADTDLCLEDYIPNKA